MFDANGNALLSVGEWTALIGFLTAVVIGCLVAVVAATFPRH